MPHMPVQLPRRGHPDRALTWSTGKPLTHGAASPTPSITAIAILALAALGAVAWWNTDAAPRHDTVTIARGDIETSVTALGTLHPRSYVDVGAQVSGQITRLLVQVGDTVEQGQLLAEIDASVPRATVDAGRAELAGLKAQLAEQEALHLLAQQQDARQRHLAGQEATRDEDVQTAAAALKTAAARMARLRAQIEQTQSTLNGDVAKLGYTRIYAPMAGTVVTLEAAPGANPERHLPDARAAAYCRPRHHDGGGPEWRTDVRRVRPGMQGRLHHAGRRAAPLAQQVRQVLPAPPTPGSQPQQTQGNQQAAPASKVVLYTVLFDVGNSDGELMPQMTAQVSFVSAEARGVVVAPLAALLRPWTAGPTASAPVCWTLPARRRRVRSALACETACARTSSMGRAKATG
ncbi:efflux RND transporter periplasmic adaptor subunit [Cupriavidus basilensis]